MSHTLKAKADDFDFAVLANDKVAQDTYRLEISSHVSWRLWPGQFMNFAVPGDASHILRIPLSFASYDTVHSHVVVYYAVVGEGTRRLSQMKPGDISMVIGPCGNGWRKPGNKQDRCLLVSGGIGAPPVVAAAHMLAESGISFDMVMGVNTSSKLVRPLVDEVNDLLADDCELVITSDDGTVGRAGFTTDAMQELLQERKYGCVYTCGPAVMMKNVARIAMDAGIACQASLERMMGCGFGACSCCNVELVDGTQASCCMDGPVFDAREVAW